MPLHKYIYKHIYICNNCSKLDHCNSNRAHGKIICVRLLYESSHMTVESMYNIVIATLSIWLKNLAPVFNHKEA